MGALELERATAGGEGAMGALPQSVAARQDLLAGLACPACARPLTIAAGRAGAATAVLHCSSCERRWPIRQRTPNFNPERREWIPAGPTALLRAPDVERWEKLRWSVQQGDPGLYGEVFDSSRDRWLTSLPLPDDAHALVLGCNWGRLASSLAALCTRVYAVDPDCLRARFVNARAFAEGYDHLLAITATGSTLPFSGCGFQLVVIEDAAALAEDTNPRRALPDLIQARGLLAPGGLLLLQHARGAGASARKLAAWRWSRLLAEAGFTQTMDARACARAGSPRRVPQFEASVGPDEMPSSLAHYVRECSPSPSLSEWWQSVRAQWSRPKASAPQSHWLLARSA